MSSKAFTLIELLVVIAIIGLIAAVALVSFQGMRERGRIAAGKQFYSSLEHGIGSFRAGMWSFEESVGSTTFVDGSGYGNNGTCSNPSCPTLVAASVCGLELGGCADFVSGESDRVMVPANQSLDITDTLTVSAWVKVENFAGAGGFGGILTYGESVETYSLTTHASPNRFGFSSNWPAAWQHVYSQSSLSTGVWYHVAGVFDKGKAYLYVQGKLDNSSDWSGTITALPMSADRTFGIGVNQPGGDEYFVGTIDEVRVFGKALSIAEIEKLYAEGYNRYLAQE